MIPAVAPVLVAGGGPTGLVAALTLLQNGVPVRIIDKEPHYRVGQKSNGLWPRTFELFHFLRVHDIHQRSKLAFPGQEYKLGTLEPAKTFTLSAYNEPTPSIPYNNLMILGQPAVESILRSHLEKYGCHVELGIQLQSFEDDGERVFAKLIKSKDGEEISETFEASYLIGADGAKGVTRKQLGLTFLGETKDHASVIGDICLEVEGVDREHWHFFGDKKSALLMLRPADEVGPDGYQFVMGMEQYDPKQLVADEKLMFECMSKLIGRDINVRKVPFLSEFRVNVRMVDKFSVGRVFVAGDAAHVHSPAGGQGLNTSVQDAFNLGWKLSLAYKGLSPASLLDSFSTERLPVVAEMLDISTGILNKMRAASTIEDALSREKRTNMLGVNYRTSPIVLEEFTQADPVSPYGVLEEGVLVAGDRAPDAPGLLITGRSETETRLFDVFGATYHTVLMFTPDAAPLAAVLEELKRYPEGLFHSMIILPQNSEVGTTVGKADIVVDHDGHAYKAYLTEKGERKVVVVRPDGVVGAIVHGVEGVRAYLSKVFV